MVICNLNSHSKDLQNSRLFEQVYRHCGSFSLKTLSGAIYLQTPEDELSTCKHLEKNLKKLPHLFEHRQRVRHDLIVAAARLQPPREQLPRAVVVLEILL